VLVKHLGENAMSPHPPQMEVVTVVGASERRVSGTVQVGPCTEMRTLEAK